MKLSGRKPEPGCEDNVSSYPLNILMPYKEAARLEGLENNAAKSR